MRDVIVPEGNAAQFRTQVSGQPSPSVQWFREGTLIPETPDFKVSLNITYNSNNIIISICDIKYKCIRVHNFSEGLFI